MKLSAPAAISDVEILHDAVADSRPYVHGSPIA
jgi:hypothetical protein